MFALSLNAGKAAARLAAMAFVALLPPLAMAQDKGGTQLKGDASLTVNAGKAETSQFRHYLTINGTVNAWQDVVISPEVGGYRVEAVLVDVGDVVTVTYKRNGVEKTVSITLIAAKK